jgi:hypothetical protein
MQEDESYEFFKEFIDRMIKEIDWIESKSDNPLRDILTCLSYLTSRSFFEYDVDDYLILVHLNNIKLTLRSFKEEMKKNPSEGDGSQH